MLVKSNSVPNFLFEKANSTIYRKYSLTLKPKIISYGEFLMTNKNSTRIERKNVIKQFYDMLFNL
jgi:hypothetical protein